MLLPGTGSNGNGNEKEDSAEVSTGSNCSSPKMSHGLMGDVPHPALHLNRCRLLNLVLCVPCIFFLRLYTKSVLINVIQQP